MPDVRVIKFTAPAAGEHEIPVPEDFLHKEDIPKAGYVTKEFFGQEIQRRLDSATKGLKKPEDLLKDDPFLQQILEARKEDAIKLLGIQTKDTVDVPRIQTEAAEKVRREELTPLKTQLTSLSDEVGETRGRVLKGEVAIAALELGIDPEVRELVEMYVEKNFAWDPEKRRWFQKKANGDEGFEFSGDPKSGLPFVQPLEFLQGIKQAGKHKKWFLDETQSGPGFNKGKGEGGPVTLERFEKMTDSERTALYHSDEALYLKLMSQKQQAGEHRLLNKKMEAPATK